MTTYSEVTEFISNFGMFLNLILIGMIFGPCIGYMIQTSQMIKTKTPESFSTYVSLVLLIANITRVYWWFIARFSTVIFCASLLMICC